MPFFITRAVPMEAAPDRAQPHVVTADSRRFATLADAEAAAAAYYASEEFVIVEANSAADALRKVLPELNAKGPRAH